MLKRTMSVLLLCAIVASTVACGDAADDSDVTTEGGATDTTTTEVTGRDAVSDNLPDKDYNGATFTILNRTGFEYEFTAEETGDVARRRYLQSQYHGEDRFNIKLETYTVDCTWGDEGDRVQQYAALVDNGGRRARSTLSPDTPRRYRALSPTAYS